MNFDYEEGDQDPRQQARNDEIRRREMLGRVDLGIQTKAFLESKVGQRIRADCEYEQKQLTDELFDLCPDVPEHQIRIREILYRCNILRHWQNKFGEYIIDGRNAEHELELIG